MADKMALTPLKVRKKNTFGLVKNTKIWNCYCLENLSINILKKDLDSKCQICAIFRWGNGWQNGSDPFISEKKIVQIMGFTVFKSSGSISWFQRKKQFWQICTESQDIKKIYPKIFGNKKLVCPKDIWVKKKGTTNF